MNRVYSVIYAAVSSSFLVLGILPLVAGASALSAVSEKPTVAINDLRQLSSTLKAMKSPTLQDPSWIAEQDAAEQAKANQRVVTYNVMTKGDITANYEEFRSQANVTLNDARGWNRLGVVFQEVVSGGNFTLVLSNSSQMPSFSDGCSVDYSCRAGQYVVINQDRWLGATSSWNNAGGTLRDYRHMVINHETGHWLGHDHESCTTAGSPAPVMQQQSIDLKGCAFNAWPLTSELWSTQLGIDKR